MITRRSVLKGRPVERTSERLRHWVSALQGKLSRSASRLGRDRVPEGGFGQPVSHYQGGGRLETTAAALAFSAALAEAIKLGNSLQQNPELADAYDDEAIEVVQNGNTIHVDIANGERQFVVTVEEAVP